ncbi:hypothetical protein BN12_4060020 [Nostocoides japonicum T1-X7]|uniref:Uncharacterized protein n=1 Tax=Nostocoides japonicum T1-X7 TaxID=1194083 RepID=A0A077M566_9MICO|nr:hypothetical protein BN12_4060020 [Tetrasphaera japonica T1-X7]
MICSIWWPLQRSCWRRGTGCGSRTVQPRHSTHPAVPLPGQRHPHALVQQTPPRDLKDSWRARCRETGTPGSDERPGETTSPNADTAPPADSYNRVHYVRDVTYDEDRSQARTPPCPTS